MNKKQGKSWYALVFSMSIGFLMVWLALSAPLVTARQESSPIVHLPSAVTIAEPLIDEGFELGAIPPEWQVYLQDPNQGGWVITTSLMYTGSYSLIHYDNFGDQDSWLVTPNITPTASSRLTFWQYENYEDFYDRHSIWVSNGDPDPKEDDYVMIADIGPGLEDELSFVDLSLANFVGQGIYIAFRYEGNFADQWGLDDILVSGSLGASNNGPTVLGQMTYLTATINGGDGAIYSWDLGDGNIATGATVSHTYQNIGPYQATVTAVSGGQTFTATTTVHVDEHITNLQLSSDAPTTPGQTTTLNGNASTGSNIVYDWSFGDGDTGTGQSITHTYPITGLYTALLTATNSLGVFTTTAPITIEQTIENLLVTYNGPTIFRERTAFTATITAGGNVTYTWDYGDGTTGMHIIANGEDNYAPQSGAEFVTSHRYQTTGQFDAIFTISNNAGTEIVHLPVYVDVPIGWGLVQDSFEGDLELPIDWSLADGLLNGIGWTRTMSQSYAGDYSYLHDDAYGDQDGWLVTPAFVPTEDSKLIFWQLVNYADYYEYHGIWVSTGSGDPKDLDFIELRETGAGTEDTWEKIETDLGDYAGQSIFIAFRYQGNWGDEWYIDAVNITANINVFNNSPTNLGDETVFTAVIPTGTNIQYDWDFGDGQNGTGITSTHQYATVGQYLATLTAQNSVSMVTKTTTVTVSIYNYLPLVLRP